MRSYRIRTRSQDTALKAAFWIACGLTAIGVAGGWAYVIGAVRAAIGG